MYIPSLYGSGAWFPSPDSLLRNYLTTLARWVPWLLWFYPFPRWRDGDPGITGSRDVRSTLVSNERRCHPSMEHCADPVQSPDAEEAGDEHGQWIIAIGQTPGEP